MILLFLSVWAIVIALNEVLFSAQPFTLTSIAAALPHTLMFSVVLSAAVYLAKKMILDAIAKGRPIDKRLVAEMTPQVGHELNNMRRKLEAMDGKGKRRVPRKGNPHRAFPSASELAASNKALLKQNRDSYARLSKGAQAKLRAEALKKQKEQIKASDKQRKAREKAQAAAAKAQQQALRSEERARQALRSGTEALAQESAWQQQGLASTQDPNEFVKEAHAQMFAEDNSGKSSASRKSPDSNRNGSSSSSDMRERRDQLAQAREQMMERRQAQIEALNSISQEEKNKQANEAKAKAVTAAKTKADSKAKAGSLAKAQAESAAKAKAQAGAKAQTEADAKSRAKVKAEEEARIKAVAFAKIEAEKAEARKIEDRLVAQKKEGRKHNPAETVRQQQALNSLQEEAKGFKTSEVSKAPPSGRAGADSISYVDQVELPKSGGLDTSGLSSKIPPKAGAGLDTSALKKVTLPNSGPNNGRGLSSRDVMNARGGTRFLNSNVTQGSISISSNGVLDNKNAGANGPVTINAMSPSGITPQQAGAAFGTTLQNDSSLARGKARTLDLAHFQASARERALARAQAPKATAQAQHVAATSNRSTTSMMKEQSTANAQPSVRSMAAQMRTALPRQDMDENAPLRKVVTGIKPQVGPARDTLPKVRPSPGIEAIQTAPVVRSRNKMSTRKRDDFLKQEPKFLDGTVSPEHLNELTAQTDKIHAQSHVNTYNKMQRQTTSGAATSGTSANQDPAATKATAATGAKRRTRSRPSDKLRTDEQV